MKTAWIALLLIALSTPTVSHAENTKEQWIKEAQIAAEKLFRNYHAVCNGKVIVRTGESNYLEFSGGSADVAVFGLYHLSESDRLNGKLWSGKIVVDMGDSSRSLSVGEKGVLLSEWGHGREAEFDFAFTDGRWRLNEKIYSPDWYLRPNVACETVKPQPQSTPRSS